MAGPTSLWMISAVFTLSLILLMVLRGQYLVGIAVACLMLSGSSVFASQSLSIGFRIEALFLLAGILIFRRRVGSGFQLDRRQSRTLVIFLTALWLEVMAVSLPHGDWSSATNACLGVIAIALLVVAPSRVLTRVQFQDVVMTALVLFLISSILVAVLFPSVGTLGTRMRGLADNANLLGFYIVLTVTVALLVEHRKRVIGLVLVLAVPCLVLTASRTSAIALLVVIVIGTIGRTGYVPKIAGLAGLAVGWFIFSGFGAIGDVTLLRSDNSRLSSWESAVWVYHHSPLDGLGLEGTGVEVATSPLRAFVAGGAVGLAFLLVAYAVLIVGSWRLGWASFTLAVGAFAHSLGEGWLVSLTGPAVLMFVLGWTVVSAKDVSSHQGSLLAGAHRQ
jgi:hypothetical protein